MKILSLYLGPCSTAAIFLNNELVAAASEERFTRLKNDDVFPENAIQYCLKEANVKPKDLDGVAIASLTGSSIHYLLSRKAGWEVKDYLEQQYKVWYPQFYENKKVNPIEIFKDTSCKSY